MDISEYDTSDIVYTGSSSSSSNSNGESNETNLIIPKFKEKTSAYCVEDLSSLKQPSAFMMQGRQANYPSIEPAAITYFSHWQGDTALFDIFDHSDMPTTSRIEALLSDMVIRLKQDPFTKFVIFSQFSESLDLLNTVLPKMPLAVGGSSIKLKCSSLDHRGKKDVKSENLRKFCEEPDQNVLLLLMGTAAAGLNLTVANVCYFLEPTHNAADEAQALGRVHRIGQLKEVQCVIFYAANTYEERLLAIRQKQGNLTSFLKSSEKMPESEDGKAISERIQASQGKSIFFNQTNLATLFGLTELRRKKKQDYLDKRNASSIYID